MNTLLMLLIDFISYSKGKLSISFVFSLLQGATAGFGLLLFLPFINLVGVDVKSSFPWFDGLLEGVLNFFKVDVELKFVLVLYVVTVVFFSLLTYYSSILKVQVQQSYLCFFRNRMFEAYTHARWDYIGRKKRSDILLAMTSQTQMLGMSANLFFTIISQLVLLIVYILLSFYISFLSSVIVFSTLTILYIVIGALNTHVYRSGTMHLKGFKEIFSLVKSGVDGSKFLKLFGVEEKFSSDFKKSSQDVSEQNVMIARRTSLTKLYYEVVVVVCFSALFYFGYVYSLVTISEAVLLLVLFSRFMPFYLSLQGNVQRLIHSLPSLISLKSTFDEVVANVDDRYKVNELVNNELHSSIYSLQVENMYYSYPGINEECLKNINFMVEKGEFLAIVGASGSGKSTLVDIVSGLIRPTKGEICINGNSVFSSDIYLWASKVAYVEQDAFFFNGTIKDNFLCVAPYSSDEAIWSALEMASVRAVVEIKNAGLDVAMGNNGNAFSGGELQRLALARALLIRPEVLILDEVTSALDKENTESVLDVLKSISKDLIIIAISHDDLLINRADRVIAIE